MSHRYRSHSGTRVLRLHTCGGPRTGTRKTGWMWPRSPTLISATTAHHGFAHGERSIFRGSLDVLE
jgi:hypothetical protein